MKIFFLIHDDYAAGGLQRSTMAARSCFAKAGHDVTVYCVKTRDGGLASSTDGVRALVADNGSKLGFWVSFMRALRKSVATERPDVCIGMGQSTGILLALATLGMPRPKLIGSERAHPPATPARLVWRLLRRFAYPRFDRIVCQTAETARWFERTMGIGRRRLAVIPNVVASPLGAAPEPPAELRPLIGHPLVACVGRLDRQKGFDMALPIFARIAKERSDARFLIVGEGPQEAEYGALAHRLGLGERLLFLPRQPDLDGLWPQVSVFLLTSRYEGIPNVLAEAMAHGVASVAFDCPTGPSELIQDSDNGFLVPLGDVEAASRRCVELLDDEALRYRLGRNAREVATRYSPNAICKLWNRLVAAED